MKYCPYCGASLVGGAASFCAECGKKIPVRAEAPQSEPKTTGKTRIREKPTAPQRRRKPNPGPPNPAKRRKNPMDVNYDGYYDDVKPVDAGEQEERIDPELVKRIAILLAGVLVVIGICGAHDLVVIGSPCPCNRANDDKDGVNCMMYLSKGLPVPEKDGTVRVSHCGRIFALGPEMAALWESARWAPQLVPRQKARFIERLEQSGLAVTTQEEGGLALYRLFSGSIICPQDEGDGQASVAEGDGRIWQWIQYAGLRLTASELVRLEEQGTEPTPDLLGEEGRQDLTEKLYSPRTIQEGVLEREMEYSPARDGLVAALLRLLRAGCLFLV